jgi:F0F1-type ATP synthase membrane subunit b/b'
LPPADAAKVQHAGRNDASSKGTEIRKDAEVFAADAGKEVDRLASQARDGTHKVDQKLEEYRQKAEKNIDQTIKKTGTELNKAVDAFDKNVGEVSLNSIPGLSKIHTDRQIQGAEKAKSGISSWFGGSK